MMQDLVSIIIPTYNRAHLIGQTLDSVLAQTYKNWECIVVDDDSSDYTDELLGFYCEKDARIQFHHRPKERPKGANACRNYGFEVSKGEYIQWFDSDDLIINYSLESKLNVFDENCEIVISKSYFLDLKGSIIGKEKRTNYSENILEDFIRLKISWYLPDPMYSRQFLKRISLFNELLKKGQDRDFHIRYLCEKPKIKFLTAYLSQYRQTDVSISKDYSESTMRSQYDAENERIKLLSSLKLKKKTKLFLLVQQIKKYPYLFRSKYVTQENFKLFLKFSMFNLTYFKWFLKYFLAVISYKSIGKGYFLLKG